MESDINKSLGTITKGTGIGIIGLLAGLGFAFLSRVLVARAGEGTDPYGVYSTAVAVLNVCVIAATLGFEGGVTRSIAFARGLGDSKKVQRIIRSSILISLIASALLSIIVFFLATDANAARIFNDSSLGLPLRIFAIGIPFLTLITIFVSIFRGFDDIRPKVYYQTLLKNTVFLLLLVPIIYLNTSFDGVFYAHLASIILVFLILGIHTVRRVPEVLKLSFEPSLVPISKELLIFSLPLLATSMLSMIITWTDTFMLQILEGSQEVGLYNAAQPMGQLIGIPLQALLLIYMPVASGLYAQGAMHEIRRNFTVLTKWLCSATLPLFLILLLFPKMVLSSLWSSDYAPAADTLMILSLGFFANNLVGPNGASLVAMGRTQFVMFATLATAALNISLNLVLIPRYGIEGAAIASAISVSSVNLLRFWKLYAISNIQPLSRNLMKPTILSVALIFGLTFLLKDMVDVRWWMIPVILAAYYGIYGASVIATRSLDREDIDMLLAIEQKLGINLTPIKKILARFL